MTADQPGRGQSVHHRHLHVHQHDVARLAGRHAIDRRLAIDGQRHPVPPFFEETDRQLLVDGIVLDQQDMQRRQRRLDAGRRGRRFGGRRRLGPAQRQGEAEGAALARRADDGQFAAHQLDQPAGDGQPQAGTAVLARGRGIGLRKGIENAGELVGGNADAGIAHGKGQGQRLGLLPFEADGEHHLAALGELDRVADQIEQHLAQPGRVPAQLAGEGRIDVGAEIQTAIAGARLQREKHLVDGLAQGEVDGLDAELARLDLREIEDVVDDAEQGIGRVAHHLEIAEALLLGFRPQRQVGHADDAVHRRADLMAHVGEEFALGLIRRLGPFGQMLGAVALGDQVGVGDLGFHARRPLRPFGRAPGLVFLQDHAQQRMALAVVQPQQEQDGEQREQEEHLVVAVFEQGLGRNQLAGFPDPAGQRQRDPEPVFAIGMAHPVAADPLVAEPAHVVLCEQTLAQRLIDRGFVAENGAAVEFIETEQDDAVAVDEGIVGAQRAGKFVLEVEAQRQHADRFGLVVQLRPGKETSHVLAGQALCEIAVGLAGHRLDEIGAEADVLPGGARRIGIDHHPAFAVGEEGGIGTEAPVEGAEGEIMRMVRLTHRLRDDGINPRDLEQVEGMVGQTFQTPLDQFETQIGLATQIVAEAGLGLDHELTGDRRQQRHRDQAGQQRLPGDADDPRLLPQPEDGTDQGEQLQPGSHRWRQQPGQEEGQRPEQDAAAAGTTAGKEGAHAGEPGEDQCAAFAVHEVIVRQRAEGRRQLQQGPQRRQQGQQQAFAAGEYPAFAQEAAGRQRRPGEKARQPEQHQGLQARQARQDGKIRQQHSARQLIHLSTTPCSSGVRRTPSSCMRLRLIAMIDRFASSIGVSLIAAPLSSLTAWKPDWKPIW